MQGCAMTTSCLLPRDHSYCPQIVGIRMQDLFRTHDSPTDKKFLALYELRTRIIFTERNKRKPMESSKADIVYVTNTYTSFVSLFFSY